MSWGIKADDQTILLPSGYNKGKGDRYWNKNGELRIPKTDSQVFRLPPEAIKGKGYRYWERKGELRLLCVDDSIENTFRLLEGHSGFKVILDKDIPENIRQMHIRLTVANVSWSRCIPTFALVEIWRQ